LCLLASKRKARKRKQRAEAALLLKTTFSVRVPRSRTFKPPKRSMEMAAAAKEPL
jgi:hypothetical protein